MNERDLARARLYALAVASPKRGLGRNVWALNLTSFFNDIGTELIFPLLPAFLTGVLGASAEALGLMEGIADAIAASLKLASGYVLQRWPRPKGVALAGYSLSSLLRPLVALAAAPWQVLLIRAGDRVGKGIRGTAADTLLADATRDGESGRVFGSNRAWDNLGALVGPLAATGLLYLYEGDLRSVFAWAWVPGILAVGALAIGVKRPPVPVLAAVAVPDPEVRVALPAGFWAYLGATAVFALASSSDAFLLLRANALGVKPALIPTLWVLLNLVKAVSAYPLGEVADRLGAAPTLVAGFLWYALSYAAFALAAPGVEIWILFPLYGVFYGLTEGVGKALVAQLAPAQRKAWAFGLYNAVVGLMALPAGLLTGVLWHRFSGPTALWACAALAVTAGALLMILSATGRLRASSLPSVKIDSK